MTKTIPLPCGRFAVVDDEDYAGLARHRWYVAKTGYVVRSEHISGSKRNRISRKHLMHRVVLNALPNEMVDHVDGDRLNNSRENLRLCSGRQNNANRLKLPNAKLSRFKGVTVSGKKRHPWKAQVKLPNGQNKNLGHFDTEERAAIAYDEASRRLFGDFARYNFPRDGERSAL